MTPDIRPLRPEDAPMVREAIIRLWGAETAVSRGRVHRPAELPAFLAEIDGEPAGLLTYRVDGEELEVVTVDSYREGAGVGTALLGAAEAEARRQGCRRLWLITTNDNLHALRFYQRRGMRLVAVHAGGVDEARKLKPEIPEFGHDGIPLRDELELER